MPLQAADEVRSHWELLAKCPQPNPWSILEDEFTENPEDFQERHYREFVTFLPHVQHFLYGQGNTSSAQLKHGDSPIRVFRRYDAVKARLSFADGQQVELAIKHVDLYFFYDIDVAILVVELFAGNLPLDRVQDIIFRFGRVFPTGWDPDGHASHCMRNVEWLDAGGKVLCESDFNNRQKFLTHTGKHRVSRVGAHWEFLLQPMAQHYSGQASALSYRLLEYHRMPKFSYIAVDDPQIISRENFIRLAMGMPPGADSALNYSSQTISRIESDIYYDRFWSNNQPESAMRVTCNGHAMNIIGCARDAWFTDENHGLLGQFRHQYFLVGLIAHFHKAALLQMSSRIVSAVSGLDVRDPVSSGRFKTEIRSSLETFLRFNHRYWFHEVSSQSMAQDLYGLFGRHLRNRESYDEVREEILDMGHYLDSEDSRRNADAVLRLTVVTIIGLIGTIVTGFLGMNLIAEADQPLLTKIGYFIAVLIPTALLTLYIVSKSSSLSSMLDTASDDRLSRSDRANALRKLFIKNKPENR